MVYVDNMNAPYGDMIMCHMVADTSDELLQMADTIGVKRKWIQYPGTKHEHFDICLSKKKLAIKAGAQEITMMEMGYMLQEPGEEQPDNRSVAQLVVGFEANPDFKGPEDITVRVDGVNYCVPYYCVPELMPDSLLPCERGEYERSPRYFTTIEMVKDAVLQWKERFGSFVLYKNVN